MVAERGLPSIPRGLDRGLTTYLQGLHSVVASIAGLARNSQDTKAVRANDSAVVSAEASTKKELGYGSIQNHHIANGVITSNKLADQSVTANKLAPGAISAEMLGENAILAASIMNGSVTTAKLAGGAVTDAKLAPSAVTTSKIENNAVTSAKIADGAVTTRKIADDAVTGSKLAGGSVERRHIALGAISATELAGGILPTQATGSASNGSTVSIGTWADKPSVAITGFSFSSLPAGGSLDVGIQNLRQSGNSWSFTARAYAVGTIQTENEDGEIVTETVTSSGRISWCATGRR